MTSKVAIVTGGSKGIGKAIARSLAIDAGMKVAIIYSFNQVEADKTASEITNEGGVISSYRVDVADETAMSEVFDEVIAEHGGVDVVINSAGIMRLGSIATFNLDDFDAMMRTNVRGTFVSSQLAARHVRSGGSIINFSTSVVKTAFPNYGAYTATKGAVEGLTLILARELRGKDVNVNTVAPGPTATDLFLDGKDDETIQKIASANPKERLGTPEDIAAVVLNLVTVSTWVNGQTIYVNGGMA